MDFKDAQSFFVEKKLLQPPKTNFEVSSQIFDNKVIKKVVESV